MKGNMGSEGVGNLFSNRILREGSEENEIEQMGISRCTCSSICILWTLINIYRGLNEADVKSF